LEDKIAVRTNPNPMPAIKQATNQIGEVCRKKRPTPKPISVVPPIAQELLSFLFIAVVFDLKLVSKGRISTKDKQ
jgi:hypothetical protein